MPRGLSGEERATTYARTSALTHVPQSPPEKKRKEKRVFLFLFPSLSFRTAESGAGRRSPVAGNKEEEGGETGHRCMERTRAREGKNGDGEGGIKRTLLGAMKTSPSFVMVRLGGRALHKHP